MPVSIKAGPWVGQHAALGKWTAWKMVYKQLSPLTEVGGKHGKKCKSGYFLEQFRLPHLLKGVNKGIG